VSERLARPRRARLRRILLDTAPLRLDRDFRWLWTGQAISGIGNQITRLALPYQVYAQTGSTLAIAGLTLFQLIPILVFSLGAGSVADAVDRRRLLRVTQLGLMSSSLALAILALQPSVPLPLLFAVAFVSAAFGSMDQPARSSSIPRLVARERLPAAIALGQLNFQIASVVGPTIAGILIATIGLAGAYVVDVLTFSASFLALFRIAPLPPLVEGARPGLSDIREGLRFAWERRVILATYVIDLDAMIFGMPQSLFPALALDVFHAGPTGLGLLASAVRRAEPVARERLASHVPAWLRLAAVIVAVAIWGIAITLFGLSTFSFALAFVFLAIAGAADVISAVFRGTILQLHVPDRLRGRLNAVNIAVVTGGPRLGDVESGVVATVATAQVSVATGGLACVVGVLALARLIPDLARWQATPDPTDSLDRLT